MTLIKGEYRYEANGKTILFVSDAHMNSEGWAAIEAGEQITFSAENENNGRHDKYIERSIMIPTGYKKTPDGVLVDLELDYQCMPVSRREIDGKRTQK